MSKCDAPAGYVRMTYEQAAYIANKVLKHRTRWLAYKNDQFIKKHTKEASWKPLFWKFGWLKQKAVTEIDAFCAYVSGWDPAGWESPAKYHDENYASTWFNKAKDIINSAPKDKRSMILVDVELLAWMNKIEENFFVPKES